MLSKLKFKITLVLLLLFIFILAGILIAQTSITDQDKKLDFEKKYAEITQKNLENCKLEVAEIEKKRALAPKDAKGNPVIYDNAPKYEKLHPSETLGIFQIQNNATPYIPSAIRERYDFTTTAEAPYDTLITGNDRQDKTIGIMIDIKRNPDTYEVAKEEYRFPGKGAITFESLETDNNIVTFRCGNGEKGYFSIIDNQAVFFGLKNK